MSAPTASTAKTRICFIGNHTKTEFFRRVAEHIDRNLVQVSWIVVNSDHRDSLERDCKQDDVLYLPLSIAQQGEYLEIKINDLIFADRRLSFIKERGLRYMRAIQAPMLDFLDTPTPTLVVGELTYGYEVLAHRMVRYELNSCHWISPFLTRIPVGHFACFGDEAFSREIFLSHHHSQEMPATGSAQEGVGYKEMNSKHIARANSIAFYIEKLRSFVMLRNFDPNDPTWISNNRGEKLRKNLGYIMRRLSYGLVPKVGIEAIGLPGTGRGRSVVFPLHVQPELNIDTCGRYWDNQAETIRNIWRQLGPDDVLFVKEHPAAIGSRGYGWYKQFLDFPNLKILHHAAAVDEVLARIDYVFTISGTMGLEAALLGKKVLCLAPTTYDRLANVVSPGIADFHRARNIDDLYDTLVEAKDVAWSKEQYESFLKRHAFRGDPEGDRIANPASWDQENLRLVAQAFRSVLDQIAGLAERG